MAPLLALRAHVARNALRGASTVAAWAALAGVGLAQPARTNEQYDAFRARVQAVVTGATVCDVGLLPASPRRPATIVAVVDYSGRLFCNYVVRVAASDPPLLLQEITGWWVAGLDSAHGPVVRDVNGDGEADLVVPVAFSDYESDRQCVATVPIVYRCGAERCADASAAAPGFYAAFREQLAVRMRALEGAPGATGREELPCLAMAAAKAERLEGVNPRAGLRVAERWMDEDDPALRRKAVWILADIHAATGDPVARTRLEMLARRGQEYVPVLRWLERLQRLRPADPW